jgi:hypothetical protein
MWNQQEQATGMTPSHVVAAVFLDEVSARDAIADLKLAGVRASQIGVALSESGRETPPQRSGGKAQRPLEGPA